MTARDYGGGDDEKYRRWRLACFAPLAMTATGAGPGQSLAITLTTQYLLQVLADEGRLQRGQRR